MCVGVYNAKFHALICVNAQPNLLKPLGHNSNTKLYSSWYMENLWPKNATTETVQGEHLISYQSSWHNVNTCLWLLADCAHT